MLHFERSTEPPPSFLQAEEVTQARNIFASYYRESTLKVSQTRVPSARISLGHPSVIDSLTRLFRGKCAFCEAKTAIRPYRFRPPTEALPSNTPNQAHLYYAWLSEAWENIYAICATCRPDRPELFEVQGARAPLPSSDDVENYAAERVGIWRKERGYPPRERPLLLDPCNQLTFTPHLHVRLDGRLDGLSPGGHETVRHFKLDREERVKERGARYDTYLAMLLDALDPLPNQPQSDPKAVFDFAALEFGGTWFLLLRRIASVLARGASAPPTLSRNQIANYMMRQHHKPGIRSDLISIIDDLKRDDQQGPNVPVRARPPERSSARLVSVEFNNFKALETLALHMPDDAPNSAASLDDQRAPALLILGENAAGKSSILEGIALALCGKAARTQLKLKAGAYILNPSYMGQKGVGPPLRASVCVHFDDATRTRLEIDPVSMFDERPAAVPPIFAYGAFRHYLDDTRRYSAAKHVMSLFKSDILLSNPEDWLLRLDDGPFNMVVRALRDILTIQGEFDVIERDKPNKQCLIVTAGGIHQQAPILLKTPLKVASSGFRSVLAMVCDIMQGLMDRRINPRFESFASARAIVLVDEIEAHLHPRWKMQIMRGLRKALPNLSFIVTSHDPLCLRGVDDGEVVVLHRVAREHPGRDETPIFVERLSELPDISQLTVEQLLTSDFFSLFSTDAPETERSFAAMADLLTTRRLGTTLSATDALALANFESQISQMLPVGTTQAQQLVQEAVAEFLQQRRTATAERMKALRAETKSRIIAALAGI